MIDFILYASFAIYLSAGVYWWIAKFSPGTDAAIANGLIVFILVATVITIAGEAKGRRGRVRSVLWILLFSVGIALGVL